MGDSLQLQRLTQLLLARTDAAPSPYRNDIATAHPCRTPRLQKRTAHMESQSTDSHRSVYCRIRHLISLLRQRCQPLRHRVRQFADTVLYSSLYRHRMGMDAVLQTA